ncbi:NAD(P)-binding protein, partial [Polyporus arcularius HHB13444]
MSSDSRVWLITGASSGIGLATVQEVLAIGERVAATTRNASSPSAADLTSLAASHPSQLLIVNYDPGDASYPASTLLSQVTSHFGRLDVVVNNAG